MATDPSHRTLLVARSFAAAPQARPRGFTLIEMLVVLSIIAAITALSMLGQSTFNKGLILTDTAYGVAFSARQAQTFGISSRKFGSAQETGYGLHFSAGSPSQYTLFADTSIGSQVAPLCPLGDPNRPDHKPGNCLFDIGTGGDGVVQTYSFTRGFSMQSFCGKTSASFGGSTDCSIGNNPLSSLDVVFTRPNTSATITGTRADGSLVSYSCAQITLTDQLNTGTSVVLISNLGEVAVGQSCP